MKNDAPVLSIIVPVYNVEKYLDKCVQSILRQTMKDIEIILVDDGSTDSSGKICDKYASDNRVKVIHKKNGGLSDARNCGIDNATADYIGFVDSDDYIKNDMYELLYNNIVAEQADISMCGFYSCYASGTKLAYSSDHGKYVLNAENTIKAVLEGKIASVSAVNKLYKRSLLLRNYFPVGKTSEDAHFIFPYLINIKKAIIDLTPKYYYVHRKGTITTKPYSKSDLSICEAYSNNRKLILNHYPELKEICDFRYYWSLFSVLDKMLGYSRLKKADRDDYYSIVNTIKQNYKNIINNKYVGRGRKIALSGLMISPVFYKMFLTAYNKKNRKLF